MKTLFSYSQKRIQQRILANSSYKGPTNLSFFVCAAIVTYFIEIDGQYILDYVALRWALLGWRVCDFLLLAFAFAHGVNGLRQVLNDYIRQDSTRRIVTWLLFTLWLILSLIGAMAIIGGVCTP